MRQMPRERPLFILPLLCCVSYLEKQKCRKTHRAPSLDQPAALGRARHSHCRGLGRSSGSPTWIGEGAAPIAQPQPVANLELRRHWSPSALLPDEPEAHCGSCAQTRRKERTRNDHECTETPRGPRKLPGNCIGVWTLVPREDINITSCVCPLGKGVPCEGSPSHLITGSLSPRKWQSHGVCEIFLQQCFTFSGSNADSVFCFSSDCKRLGLALLIPWIE